MCLIKISLVISELSSKLVLKKKEFYKELNNYTLYLVVDLTSSLLFCCTSGL